MKNGTRLFGLAFLAVGCARNPSSIVSSTLPGVLAPFHGAAGIKQAVYPSEAAAISYSLHIPYPASAIVAEVEAKAASSGWQPLNEDFWNPGIPTSSVRGWTSYLDHSRPDPAVMHQWQSCWRNKDGALLEYSFWYRTEPFTGSTPPSAPGNDTLLVSAQLIEREAAEHMRKQGAKGRP